MAYYFFSCLGLKVISWLIQYFTLKRTLKYYFLLCNKKSRFDFADELKVRDVGYDNITKITIKVQLFWRLAYEM